MGNGSFLIDFNPVGRFIFSSSEQNEGVLFLSEDSFNFVLSELEESWDHEWLEPGRKAVLVGNSGIDVCLCLELSEENFTWHGSTELVIAGLIVGMNKLDFLFSFSSFDVSLSEKGIRLLSEVSKDELGSLNLGLDGITVRLGACGSRLLEDPGDDSVLGSSSFCFTYLKNNRVGKP